MKISSFIVGFMALLTPVSAAWSKDDREIFRVRAEIQSAEGADVTFYDYMGISKNADLEDIKKGYRKMTRQLHPDKVRQRIVAQKSAEAVAAGRKPVVPSRAELKKANQVAVDKQARLTIINDILRGPARSNYDFYLANGFPLWKGTDYYYQRYRPGFGTVLAGLFFIVGGGFHYLALYMSWKQHRDFIGRHVKYARDQALGEVMRAAMAPTPTPVQEEEQQEEQAPIPRNRRERRLMEKQEKADGKKPVSKRKSAAKSAATAAAAAAAVSEDEDVEEIVGPVGARRRVLAQNGKILVVDSQGDVFLEDEDEDGHVNLILLDPEELPAPTVWDTAVLRAPLFVVNTVKSRLGLGSPASVVEDDSSDAAQDTPDTGSDFELVEASVEDLGKATSSGSQATKTKGTKRR